MHLSLYWLEQNFPTWSIDDEGPITVVLQLHFYEPQSKRVARGSWAVDAATEPCHPGSTPTSWGQSGIVAAIPSPALKSRSLLQHYLTRKVARARTTAIHCLQLKHTRILITICYVRYGGQAGTDRPCHTVKTRHQWGPTRHHDGFQLHQKGI